MINCKIELDLSWPNNCVNFEISRKAAIDDNPNANPPAQAVRATQTDSLLFQITSDKLYVPGVTLSIHDSIKFLENLKQGFTRTVCWNEYRSERTTQLKNNSLNYLIDPTFKNIYRFFVLSFRFGRNMATRYSFLRYYQPLVEIKDFNVLIDYKPFKPVKNKQGAYEKLIKMSRNDDYTTGNILDFLYHQKYYKLIDIDLPRQTNTSIP